VVSRVAFVRSDAYLPRAVQDRLSVGLDQGQWKLERDVLGPLTSAMNTKRTLAELFSFEPYRPLGPPERERSSRADRIDLPACSGDECARALEKCGMLRFDERADVLWMECGATFVAVPVCGTVPRETLADILAKSGLSRQTFVRHLRSTSGLLAASTSQD
jgi:hypothetical protein